MSAINMVHCHVCPLKDFCWHAQEDASYQVAGWFSGRAEFEPEKKEYEKVEIATNNCPLRRLIA